MSCVVVALFAPAASAQAPEEFQKRRQAVRDLMDPDSVLIVRNTPLPDDMGTLSPDPNFFYLTGSSVSDPATLVLFASKRAEQAPADERRFSVSMLAGRDGVLLFKRPPVPTFRPSQVGQPMPPPAAPQQAGFAPNTVRNYTDFQSFLDLVLLNTSGTVYLDYRRTRSVSAPLTEDEQLLKQARDHGAAMTIKPASTLLAKVRAVKSAEEIRLLKQAAEITAAAEREAMRAARPGLFEYQLQSIIEHVFTINGARRPGFSTIVGSGPNSCILHWSENTRQTKPGDVVVLDIGAEFEHYTADITRTIPVSGTFTRRQRDIYEIVLQANEQAIAMMKPGVSMRDVSAKVNDVLGEGLLRLGVIKDKAQTGMYSWHGPTHPIGLIVHDVGSTAVLQPGMVVTMEPGLYFPDEELGIRIEDDVLITEAGHEVITASAPKSVADVEALMKQRAGIDFSRYLVKKVGTN
jgi:Xaa-Pro aminopeptidase